MKRVRAELETEIRALKTAPATASRTNVYRDTALHVALREAIAGGDRAAEAALRPALAQLGRERGRWAHRNWLHRCRHWLDSARFYVAFTEASGRAVLRLNPTGWRTRKWRRFRDPTIADVTDSVHALLRGRLTLNPGQMALAVVESNEGGYGVVPFLPGDGPPADAVVVVDRGESRHTRGTLPHIGGDILRFIGGAPGHLVWRKAVGPMAAGSLCAMTASRQLRLDDAGAHRTITGAQEAGDWVAAFESPR